MTRPNRIWCTRRSPFRRSVEVNFIPDYRILHDAGYNVLAYDLRNFGLSGAANGGIASSGIFESRDVVPLSGARRRADRTERCADDVRQHPDRRQAASLDPRNHRTLGWLPRISATARTCARVGSRHTWPEENDVSVPTRAVSAHDPHGRSASIWRTVNRRKAISRSDRMFASGLSIAAHDDFVLRASLSLTGCSVASARAASGEVIRPTAKCSAARATSAPSVRSWAATLSSSTCPC